MALLATDPTPQASHKATRIPLNLAILPILVSRLTRIGRMARFSGILVALWLACGVGSVANKAIYADSL